MRVERAPTGTWPDADLRRLVDANIIGVLIATPEAIVEANDIFLAMVGRTREELEAGRLSWQAMTPPESVGASRLAIEQLVELEVCEPFEKDYVRPDGSRVPVYLGAALLDREPLRWISFVLDLRTQKDLESRLTELLARQHEQRERERHHHRAVERLSGSKTAAEVAAAIVNEGRAALEAVHAVVFLLAPDGRTLELAARSDRDPHSAGAGPTLSLDAQAPCAEVVRTARLLLIESEQELARRYPRLDPASPSGGASASITLPLIVDDCAVGAFSLGFGAGRVLDPGDAALATTFGRQCSEALERTLRAETDHEVALTLQRSVLPERLPVVEGVEVAAHYGAGARGLAVGGDWYDVFVLPDGQVACTVGDVVGKGVKAAALMAQLRNALRVFALERLKPASVMARLNALAPALGDEAYATIVLLVLDPRTGRCRIASAGHYPPVLREPDGKARFMSTALGPPIGAADDARYRQSVFVLEPGSTVVLYTDGLVERRSASISARLERLRSQVEASASAGPASCVEQITAALAAEPADDDVALLVVDYLHGS